MKNVKHRFEDLAELRVKPERESIYEEPDQQKHQRDNPHHQRRWKMIEKRMREDIPRRALCLYDPAVYRAHKPKENPDHGIDKTGERYIDRAVDNGLTVIDVFL